MKTKEELAIRMKDLYDKDGAAFLKVAEEVRECGFHWIAKMAAKPSYMTFWIDEHSIVSYLPKAHLAMIEVRMRKKPYKEVKDKWLCGDGCPYF